MATMEEFFGEPTSPMDKMFEGSPSFADLIPDSKRRAEIMRLLARREELTDKDQAALAKGDLHGLTDAEKDERAKMSERPAVGHTLQETREAGEKDNIDFADALFEAHNLSVREGDRVPLTKAELDKMYEPNSDWTNTWTGRTKLDRPQVSSLADLVRKNNVRRAGVMDRTDAMYDSEDQLTPAQAKAEMLRKDAGARSYPTELARNFAQPIPTYGQMTEHYGMVPSEYDEKMYNSMIKRNNYTP